jgi:hypothetical protein
LTNQHRLGFIPCEKVDEGFSPIFPNLAERIVSIPCGFSDF